MLNFFLKKLFKTKRVNPRSLAGQSQSVLLNANDIKTPCKIGIIAGNGRFPFLFAESAKSLGHKIFAVCHENETELNFPGSIDGSRWIRLGQLGTMISFFKEKEVDYVVFAGGISRVKHFGDIKLDARGASLMLKMRSTKDDVVMRGISGELEKEGMPVIPCSIFMQEAVCPLGNLTKSIPTREEEDDIKVGISAIEAMSSQDIGQLVVVREGVVVSVEAVEGSNEAIKRGANLGGKGSIVVKFAKPTQDMRFDVPTIGTNTIKLLIELGIRVLALEAGRSLILDKDECIAMADEAGISILGVEPLVKELIA